MVDSQSSLRDEMDREATEEILESLEESGLEKWGFVIYRCTYASDEKWNKFMFALKEVARKCVTDKHVSDALTWTVFDDRKTLDGASVLDASRKFMEWVKVEGMKELEERQNKEEGEEVKDDDEGDEDEEEEDDDENAALYPRYKFFMYVDKESVESVLDDPEAGNSEWYRHYFNLVYAEKIVSKEDNKEAHTKMMQDIGYDTYSYEEEMADLMLELKWRIRIVEFVRVYAFLSEIEKWDSFIPLMDTGRKMAKSERTKFFQSCYR